MGIIKEKQKKTPSKRPLASPSQYIAGKERADTEEDVRALFKALGIQYLDHTVFSNQCAILRATKRIDLTTYVADIAAHNSRSKEYQKLRSNAAKKPFYIKWISADIGYGVFASRDIAEGELLAEYTGIVWPRSEVKDRTWSWKYPIKGEFAEGLPQSSSLDGAKYGNELRFVNHGDERNTSPVLVYNGTTWVNCYYARKAIAKDQELLVSYGNLYWKHRVKIPL